MKSLLDALQEGRLIELPENDWVQTGEIVLSTDSRLPVGTHVKAGDRLSIGRRTVVVFRET